MKKNFFILASAALVGFSFLTSCSDDNDPKLPSMDEITVTDGAGLSLTVNGQPMLGKTVKFTPDATDATKGTLTISSTFDLTAIPGYTDGMIEGNNLQAPGMLPGSPVTEIPVTLLTDGDAYTFSGNGDADYCTYSYSGKIEKTSISLDVKDVKLKNTSLAGTTWKLNQFNGDATNQDEFPFHIVWEPYDSMDPSQSANITIDLGFPMQMPIQDVLKLALAIPMLENPSDPEGDGWSAAQMLGYCLESISFMEDGNVSATYRNMKTGGTVETSAYNMMQYVVKANGSLLLFLNPQAIAAADAKTKAVDFDQIIKSVMGQVLPMLANGIPMNYTTSGNRMDLYLGNDVLLPLVKGTLLPILKDEDTMKMLADLIASNEGMADYAQIIQGVLNSLPEALEKTTKIELGLAFTKVQ